MVTKDSDFNNAQVEAQPSKNLQKQDFSFPEKEGELMLSEELPFTTKNGDKCQNIWSSIWLSVEKGDVESRGKLLGHMYADQLELPGRSGDYVTRIRDFTILLVHSAGSMKSFEEMTPWKTYLNGLAGKDEFVECMKQGPSQRCSKIMVDYHAIPPFQSFVNEINAMMAQGYKPHCVFRSDTTIELPSVQKNLERTEK